MERARFGPEKIGLLPVLVFLLGTIPLAGSSRWLAALVLLPLAAAVWVLRARVVADGRGVLVCNGLRSTAHAWSEVEGVDLPRWHPVVLVRSDGRRVPMTALSRGDVRALLALAPRAPA